MNRTVSSSGSSVFLKEKTTEKLSYGNHTLWKLFSNNLNVIGPYGWMVWRVSMDVVCFEHEVRRWQVTWVKTQPPYLLYGYYVYPKMTRWDAIRLFWFWLWSHSC